MTKDDQVYVGHMLDLAETVANKVSSCTREHYDADQNLRLALTHLIQIIGEEACRRSMEYRGLHQGIPWSRIVGMRQRQGQRVTFSPGRRARQTAWE